MSRRALANGCLLEPEANAIRLITKTPRTLG
jgi:hypothetical protein